MNKGFENSGDFSHFENFLFQNVFPKMKNSFQSSMDSDN